MLKKSDSVCTACSESGNTSVGRHSNPLEPHHIVPVSKGGETTVENGAILCRDCHVQVHDLARKSQEGQNFKKEKLTKSKKKKTWKIKGTSCQKCGLTLTTGGSKIAIHPFRPAGYTGGIDSIKVLCSSCLGNEARKRDKILEFVKRAN